MKIFKPEIFQGNFRKKRYFEGWYFKHVSENRKHVFSFIPGISLAPNDKHAFIQFIDGINGQTEYIRFPLEAFNFSDEKGYLEKDWGTSFPESWIWLHSNTFNEPDCSFTFSVAKIPWMGSFFIGHICFLYVRGLFYTFATYNNSKIKKLAFTNKTLEIELRRKNLMLKIRAVQKRSGSLKAPVTGEMSRMIKESVDSEIEITLTNEKGNLLHTLKGERAGMEIIEKILTYF